MEITVYTRSNCVACLGTKNWFKKLGVPFTEISVEENLDVAQQLVDEGWRAMPVVKLREGGDWGDLPDRMSVFGTDLGYHWSGMDVKKIKKAAKLFAESMKPVIR